MAYDEAMKQPEAQLLSKSVALVQATRRFQLGIKMQADQVA
jgi:hypothetical protein